MIPKNIFDIGDMLGLEDRDIQNLLSDKKIITNNQITPCSPMATYKEDGTWYGTISINDF